MKGPERIETLRLILRKPTLADAEAVFSRYSSDPEVTRLRAWPMHRSIEDTRAFLSLSDAEWLRWPAGPYLIESKDNPRLLGSTGLSFETADVAATGFVLAKDAWGCGYATEAVGAIVTVARQLGVNQLYALCHPSNPASIRVLEKCRFKPERARERSAEFPNLAPGVAEPCLFWLLTLK
jgi:ribosomal-protein-alanine N-acetyltransferase